MPISIRKAILLFCQFLYCYTALATHSAGGGFSYRFIDSTADAYRYEITLTFFEDCSNGNADAIAQDNPAFWSIFDGNGTRYLDDTAVYSTSSSSVPFSINTSCGLASYHGKELCLIKKTFTKAYLLPRNTTGYTIAYQRCCRVSRISNIHDPGDVGMTYYCQVPAMPVINTSAQYNSPAPSPLAALNHPYIFDNSATDADGDSLSYELCECLNGANGAAIKPLPVSPPYSPVTYVAPLSATNPVTAATPMSMNAVTGIATVTPTSIGAYEVAALCKEWRNGVLINTSRREFMLNVVAYSPDSLEYHPYAGINVTVMAGDTVRLNASGGVSYSWSPSTYLDNPMVADPLGTFPDAGTFTYTVTAVNDSGCTGKDAVTVFVHDHTTYVVPSAFSPNNDGRNDLLIPIANGEAYLKEFRVFDRKGKMVFHTTIPGDGWDGYYKGKKQDIGTYYWELRYEDDRYVPRTLKGDVTLVE